MACSFGAAMMKEQESSKRRKKWVGGDIYDNVGENSHPHNSSGEPHTNEYEEEEHPMEFMANGGLVPPTSYSYEGDKNYNYDSNYKGTKIAGGNKDKAEEEPDHSSDMAGPDSSDMGSGMEYASTGKQMKRKEDDAKTAKAAAALGGEKMYDGGKVPYNAAHRPGLGRGGALKGAFEPAEEPAPMPKVDQGSDDAYVSYDENGNMHTKKKHAGGEAKTREEADLEEMPHMMAGGEAAIPEEKEYQEDPGVDPDASFVAEFLRARKSKASAPGR